MRPSLFVSLLILGACGGDDTTSDATDDTASVPRETVTETKTLIGSELAEGTLEGGPADRAVVRITANAANLDWNIHGHVGQETMTIAEGLQVMSVEEEFVPPADEHWSLLVRNHSAVDTLELTVEIDLYGDMVWETWGAHSE